MAQIHALLYLSPRPLHAEEIVGALQVARSNVSNSLRELQGWKIVRTVHIFGDRRDHFNAEKDVWELFRTILAERKAREIDPTIATLRECAKQAKADEEDPGIQERLEAMLLFFETTNTWYETVAKLPADALIRFLKLGERFPRTTKN